MLVEFVTVAAIVLVFALAAAVLVASGTDDDNAVISALLDAVKVGFGALIALAYAARGIVRRNGGDE
jgi:hypothetical protein